MIICIRHQRASVSCCNFATAIDGRRRAPAICDSISTDVGELLQFAAAFRRTSASSCNLRRHFDGRRRAPAICSGISTVVGELLHFCNGHRRSSASSCTFATVNQALGRVPANIRQIPEERNRCGAKSPLAKKILRWGYRFRRGDVLRKKTLSNLNILILC